jgi:hypothetical protein
MSVMLEGRSWMLRSKRRAHRLAGGSLLACTLLAAGIAHAMCDVIPGVTQEFRGALGSLDRPFALPNDDGEILRLRLARDPMDPNACDDASPGFPANAKDVVVTVVFDPPAGPSNAVTWRLTATRWRWHQIWPPAVRPGHHPLRGHPRPARLRGRALRPRRHLRDGAGVHRPGLWPLHGAASRQRLSRVRGQRR